MGKVNANSVGFYKNKSQEGRELYAKAWKDAKAVRRTPIAEGFSFWPCFQSDFNDAQKFLASRTS